MRPYPCYPSSLVLLPLALAWVLSTGVAASPTPRPDPAVLVRFERTACYGPCPVDVLTIFQNGRIRYQGQANSPRTGTYCGRLSATERRELVAAFAAAHFFELAPAYTSAALDLPTYYLTYATGGQQHRVADYDGAPTRLKALEARLTQLIEAPRRWRR